MRNSGAFIPFIGGIMAIITIVLCGLEGRKMRLIDADALQIALIRKYDEVADLLEIVDNQPTAYDVDKVVEEIEAFGGCAECREKGTDKRFYYGMGCKAYVFGKIVNIVKRGGVE